MSEEIDLEAHCRALALSVAALDDAGLDVHAKSAIAKARWIRKRLAERLACQREAQMRKDIDALQG